MDLPNDVLALLYDKMSQIEQRLAIGCSEKLQSYALISAFFQARELAFEKPSTATTSQESSKMEY